MQRFGEDSFRDLQFTIGRRIGARELQLTYSTYNHRISFDMTAIVLGYHHTHRMLRDAQAGERARTAFERLLADSKTRLQGDRP